VLTTPYLHAAHRAHTHLHPPIHASHHRPTRPPTHTLDHWTSQASHLTHQATTVAGHILQSVNRINMIARVAIVTAWAMQLIASTSAQT
jgi:hypothetical protein